MKHSFVRRLFFIIIRHNPSLSFWQDRYKFEQFLNICSERSLQDLFSILFTKIGNVVNLKKDVVTVLAKF